MGLRRRCGSVVVGWLEREWCDVGEEEDDGGEEEEGRRWLEEKKMADKQEELGKKV